MILKKVTEKGDRYFFGKRGQATFSRLRVMSLVRQGFMPVIGRLSRPFLRSIRPTQKGNIEKAALPATEESEKGGARKGLHYG